MFILLKNKRKTIEIRMRKYKIKKKIYFNKLHKSVKSLRFVSVHFFFKRKLLIYL